MTDQPPTVPDAPVETELKFEFEPAQLRSLARHPAFAGKPVVKKLTSTYFDTPSFALRQAGFTLRVRRVGTRFIQTVKRDRGSMFERDEWETPVPTRNVDMVALEATPAGKAAAKTGEPLVPVAVIRANRAIRLWADGDAAIEIVVDRCEIEAGAAKHSFMELELELKAGQAKAVHALAGALFDITPLRLGLTSKGERGYRLAGAKEAAFDPELTAEMPVAAAFAAIARACLAQVIEQAAAFRAKAHPEGIHQTRVGLRRLRTALRLFETVVRDHDRDRLNAEVEWLANELGPARNLDVFLEDVFDPTALTDPGVAKRYEAWLQRARKAAYQQASAALESPRFARLTLDLALWIEDGDWLRPIGDATRAIQLGQPAAAFAAVVLEDLRRTVKKRGKDLVTLDVERRHSLRIRCKRLRYASEFFAHAFDSRRKKHAAFVGALKEMQNALGLLNDMAQAHESAAETLGKGAPQQLVFAAGELVGRLRAKKGKNLEKSVAGYDALMKAERFWGEPASDKPAKEKPAKEKAGKGKKKGKGKKGKAAKAAKSKPPEDGGGAPA